MAIDKIILRDVDTDDVLVELSVDEHDTVTLGVSLALDKGVLETLTDEEREALEGIGRLFHRFVGIVSTKDLMSSVDLLSRAFETENPRDYPEQDPAAEEPVGLEHGT